MKFSLSSYLLSALLAATTVFSLGCTRASADSTGAYKAVETAAPAPDWELVDLDGKPLRFSDFKGKVVVIDFWATWCPPCIAELPGYIELQKKLGPEGFTLIGLSVDQISPAEVKKFVEKKGINYPVAIAGPDQVAAFGNFEGIPATFVIDREGKLRFQKLGMAPIADLEKVAAKLL